MTSVIENEIDALYPDLTSLLFAVAIQNLDPSAVPAGLEALMPTAGRATLRNRGGDPATNKAKAEKVTISAKALEGAEKYPRPNGQDYYARIWGESNDVETLRKLREANKPVMFYGSPGTGKTALVEATFGEELLTIIGSGDTELSDFIGGYVQTPSGGFEWVDGALVICAEQGRPLLIDEIGLIDTKVLSALYGLMDGRGEITITQNPERGTIKAKEGFYVISATNPNAPGVRLSEALLSRFLVQVEMTTDWGLAKKLGVSLPMVTSAQNLAKKQLSGEVSWSPQMRELLAFRDLSEIFGTKWAIQNLLASTPENDRPVVADVLTRVFGEEVKPAKI
jgi:nitric oxide reductase NorQ protein